VTGNFIQPWGVNGVPETFVINRQGRIVALRRYQIAGNWLQQTVAPLLTEAS
jgi:cytochrome c biogenesis protein CcmG/thiol:disulfide interchange protein DsbE